MSSREPDGALETVVRFVCGALAGALFGFWMGVRLDLSGTLALLGITMAFYLVFAVCAVRYGDDFWYALLRK